MTHAHRIVEEIRPNVDHFCRGYVQGMLSHLERRGIIASADQFYQDLDLRVSCARNRVRSNGGVKHGRPKMSIGVAEAAGKLVNHGGMIEYKSFEADPVIGRIWTSDIYDVLRGILAHELAHAVQFSIGHGHASPAVFRRYQGDRTCELLPVKERRKPHGDLFKAIYAELRTNCVNGNLPDQADARMKCGQALDAKPTRLGAWVEAQAQQMATDAGEPAQAQQKPRSKAKGRNLGVCATLRDLILEGHGNHEAAAKVREMIPLSRATNRDAQIERRGLRKMGYDV